MAVLDPFSLATGLSGLASLISGAISSYQKNKQSKLRSKEMKRETRADLLNDSQNRRASMHEHNLSTRAKAGKRRASSMQSTADLVRGALNK